MIAIKANLAMPVNIGHQGENDARCVQFDLSEFQTEFPSGIPLLIVQRPNDTTIYPIALEVDGTTAIWTVTATETEYTGLGKCVLQWSVDDVVVKSCMYITMVAPSLTLGAGTMPDEPGKSWYEHILSEIGNLDNLTTKSKDNLVNAINEAAKTGSGTSGGGTVEMRVSDGYIQYGDGTTWNNLIALSELKGTDGHTPEITATKTDKTTTISVDGKSVAEIKDGTDGTTPSITATKSGAVTAISVNGKVVAEIKDGTTPTKGTDYWTEADKTEIVEDTKEAIDLSSYAKTEDVPTKVSQLTNDSKFIDASGAPVQSVNGMTGDVVVDTEASVCEGVVLPNIEYPEFAIETIILKQYLKLVESPNYVDIIAGLKDDTNNTIVWYSDIYTALTDINAGVVTNGSSTEISTGVKVMKLGKQKYTNTPAKIFILQLLADITLTETLYIDTECVIDLNGHTITDTCSSSRTNMLIAGHNAKSPEFAVTIYGMKSGSAITLNGDETITTRYSGIMCYFRNAYVSVIGGRYTMDVGSTPLNGILFEVYPFVSEKSSDGKYQPRQCLSIMEAYNASFKASASPTDSPTYFECMDVWSDFTRFENCTIDYNVDGTPQYNSEALICGDIGGYDGLRNSLLLVKNSTITAYSKPTSSIQSATGIFSTVQDTIVRNSTIHTANCAVEGTCNFYVSDSVLEGGEHGGIYTLSGGSSSRNVVKDSSTWVDYTHFDLTANTSHYIQNTILRKLDGTGSPHNNLYSCYFGGGPVYCNNVTFDSYNGQYNRPALKYDGTTAYLSNCSLSDIRVDANCKAVFGAGIPDAVRNASVSGTIVNKPTEVYSAVISRDVGGLMNQVIDRVRQNEEAIEKLSASPTTVTKQSVIDALGYTPAAIGNPEKWALLQTTTVTDATVKSYVFTFDEPMERIIMVGSQPSTSTDVLGITMSVATDVDGVAPGLPYLNRGIELPTYTKPTYTYVWAENGVVNAQHTWFAQNGNSVTSHWDWTDTTHTDSYVHSLKNCSCYRGNGYPVGTVFNVYGMKASDVGTDAAAVTKDNIVEALGYTPEITEGAYELLSSTTITESGVTNLTINTDANGNAIDLKHGVIVITPPSSGSTSDIGGSLYWYGTSDDEETLSISGFFSFIKSAGSGNAYYWVHVNGSRVTTLFERLNSKNSITDEHNIAVKLYKNPKITKAYLYVSVGFVVGTTIAMYGVKSNGS